jgi:cytochrome c-type biogenesis protein CcsB
MLKKIFSMKMAVVAMVIFAVAIGYATFIENDYGTQSARALVYNAKWFEVLLLYFTLLVIYNIFVFKMYKRQKWGQLVLHISFVLVAVGALITRYIGYEGILHLREGQSKASMVSDYMALTINAKDKNNSYIYEKRLTLSSMTKNNISQKVKVANKDLNIKLLKYIPSAKEGVVPAKNGYDILELVISGKGFTRETLFLKDKEARDLGAFIIAYNLEHNFGRPTLTITKEGDKFFINAPFEIDTKSMDTLKDGHLGIGKHELKKRFLHIANGVSLVFKKAYANSKVDYIADSLKSDGKYPQMIDLNVTSGKESKFVRLFGRKGIQGDPKEIELNGMKLTLSYGPKVINLPFSIKLDRFEMQRYPGSKSPSSYSSYVTVIDKAKTFKYHIYMNHVLDYKGYRFFQSSYDMDEKGSILSVNHDPGTLPTYIGYLLMIIGFIWSYISKKGRIMTLLKKLSKLDKKATAAIVVFVSLFTAVPSYGASISDKSISSEQKSIITSISKEHTDKLATLIVQDSSGRMEPLDTLAKAVVRKISGKSGFFGLDYNQIFLGIMTYPEIYQKLKIIKITHPLIAKNIGIGKDAKYASFNDFFTEGGRGEYKLIQDLKKAREKRAAVQDAYDKELIKVDEKLNVLYMTQQGMLLKIFPKPNDPTNTWYNPTQAFKTFPKKEGDLVRYITGRYLGAVIKASKDGNWSNATNELKTIANYQKFYGSSVMPPQKRVDAEIFYNHIDIFNKLTLAYVLIGLALLVFAFISIVKPNLNIKLVTYVATLLLVIVFLIHTAGLGLRWYIADHAPWSDSYESILFISWATALAGFVFAKRSALAFAATSILAGIFLFVAFLSTLNPQVTNLVPVLKSYWLMIHVAVITSSYGFLALGALLGLFVMVLFIVDRNKHTPHIIRAIKELTIINEITLIIGLGLLTVGNFLGGVWANESWGRYWGWDPKETWAAVTILVYAAVVHMRFIPSLNSIYKFNVAAILAYFSVIMTYFGVNYYLSGMHSYAAGDPVPIPAWVYFAVSGVFLLIAAAKRFEVKGKL